mgnify:CR=1 FL=1
MSWKKLLKWSSYGDLVFHVNAKVTTEDEDGEVIDINERHLHGLAQDVLQEMIGKTFSQEFDDDEGKEFTVTCEITSVSENR